MVKFWPSSLEANGAGARRRTASFASRVVCARALRRTGRHPLPRAGSLPAGVPRFEIPLLIELALLLGLTGAAAAAFGRSLRADAVYDEGVYLASVDAVAHGQKLGSEIFASQPPGFYVLLEAERAVFGGSLVDMRVAMLLLALVGCLSAYYVGRYLAGPPGGLLAMALLASPRRVEDEAVRVRADFPSLALSLLAIALALVAVRRTGAMRLVAATLAGSALAVAVSVKLLAATAVVPVLVIVLRHGRRLIAAFAAGTAAVVVAFAGFYAGVLGPLWNDAVRFHLKAQSAQIEGAPRDLAGNFAKIVGTLTDYHGVQSPFPWLVAVGGVGTLAAWRRRQLFEAVPLWLWVAASAAFLAWHRPLWAHDIVMLTTALAVASGVGLAALLAEGRLAPRAVAAACVIVIAASIAHHLQITSAGESSGIKWAAAVLRAHTPAGSEVGSDLPIIPFLANRRQPGALIDTSSTRLGSGWLTEATIIRAIDDDGLSAVVIGHNFAADRQVVQAVQARFPFSVRRDAVSLPGEKPSTVRLYFRFPPRRSS
jgi:Dolichyl-phosphate-mannose-protein mannosyltransferase